MLEIPPKNIDSILTVGGGLCAAPKMVDTVMFWE